MTAGLTEPLLEELRAGRHDLVIATSRPRGRALSAVPMGDEEFVLVAAPVWAERLGGRLAAEGPAALHGVPLVAYAEDLPIVRRYWRHVFGHAARLPGRPDRARPARGGRRGGRPARASRSSRATSARTGWPTVELVLLDDPEDPPINTGYLVERPGADPDGRVARVRDHLLAAARTW